METDKSIVNMCHQLIKVMDAGSHWNWQKDVLIHFVAQHRNIKKYWGNDKFFLSILSKKNRQLKIYHNNSMKINSCYHKAMMVRRPSSTAGRSLPRKQSLTQRSLSSRSLMTKTSLYRSSNAESVAMYTVLSRHLRNCLSQIS